MEPVKPITPARLPAGRRVASVNGASALSHSAAGPAPIEAHHETVVESIWRILRHRKWIVLQSLVLVPLAVLALSLLQERQYTAESSLRFHAPASSVLGTSDAYQDPDREASTNQELLQLPIVAQGAARALGGGLTGPEVDRMVSVDAAGQSDVVNIKATAPQPAVAAQVANAYGDAYINFRRESDRAQLRDAIRLVERNIALLAPEERTSSEARRLREQLEDLQFRQSLQTGNASLVQRAATPREPSSPNIKRNLAFGIILGGALGFALASLLERFDRRLKTVEDLERAYGIPVIARVPRSRELRRGSQSAREGLVRGPEAEAFRTLRANLRFVTFDRDVRSLLVASPMSGDGKSTVARFLAMTMADMGDDVVLVEADLHKRGMSESMVPADGGGLSRVLVEGGLDESLVEIGVGNEGDPSQRYLTVLPSGPLPPNQSELLESERMREVIRELESRYELVIIDTPPLSIVSDALSLVPEVSGVLVVSGLQHTTRDAARELTKQLALLGERPVGVVANFAAADRSGYYYQG